jgi:hypothetical protein
LNKVLLILALIAFLLLTGCEPEVRYIFDTQTVTKTVTEFSIQTVTITTSSSTNNTSFSTIRLSGNSDMNTAVFTVTSDAFLINWSYTPQPGMADDALFNYFLYPAGETVIYVNSVLFPTSTSGSTYCYAGAGQYYFSVACYAVTVWNITISPA